jgi:hypothetical protein
MCHRHGSHPTPYKARWVALSGVIPPCFPPYLSNMSHPLIWQGKTFFYPIGNTSAVCLTQDLAPEEPADVLLLGCGDTRNILYTTYADTQIGESTSSSPHSYLIMSVADLVTQKAGSWTSLVVTSSQPSLVSNLTLSPTQIPDFDCNHKSPQHPHFYSHHCRHIP